MTCGKAATSEAADAVSPAHHPRCMLHAGAAGVPHGCGRRSHRPHWDRTAHRKANTINVSFAQAAGHAKSGTAPWHKLHSSWLRSRPQLQRVATLGGILNDAFLNDWVAKGGSLGAQRGKWPPGRKCGNAFMTYFLRLAHCDDFLQNGSCRRTAKHALDRCAACPVGLHTLNDIVMAPESRSGRQITATVIAGDQ